MVFSSLFHSIKANRKGLILMLFSSLCVCIGQLLWKLSADEGIWALLLGFLFYGIGALAMPIAYRYGKLSVLQPMLSMNYVFCIILASIVLGEVITIQKYIGVFVILLGVVLVAGGDE